jgi:hypothetical protein
MSRNYLKHVLLGTAIVLLVFQMVCLSALAKQNQALPSSNPERFLSNATKMVVRHLPTPLLPALLEVVVQAVPLQPGFRIICPICPERVEVPQIGLTVLLQHRSPPSASL